MAENQKGTFIVKINHTDNAWMAQSHQRKQKTVENMAGMCYTA